MQTLTGAYQAGLRDGAALILKVVKEAIQADPQLNMTDLLGLLTATAKQIADYGGAVSS